MVAVEILSSREVPLGGPRAMTVHRTLPQKQRSLIGAWCFVDHYGPDRQTMDVPCHPHTGLQTVSWLFEGEIEHNDSGGYHATVRPGEVNLMTAGAGICHTEVSTSARLHGVQLWTVLPDAVRNRTPRALHHHAAEPVLFDGGQALVFLGTLLGSTSPVPTHSPLLGADLRLEPHSTVTVDVDPQFEHGLLVDSGTVTLEGYSVDKRELAYTGVGAETLTIANMGEDEARMLLIGGEPLGEDIVMWWNFVGRDYEEIERYREEWQQRSERFGDVSGYTGNGPAWLPAPKLPHATIKPRKNPPPVAQARSAE